MRHLLLAMALALGMMPVAAQADPAGEIIELDPKAPLTIAPDKAYFLIRLDRPKGAAKIEPILLRVPREQELKDYYAARAAAFAKAEPDLRKARAELLAKKAAAEAKGKTYNEPIPPEPTEANYNFVWDARANVDNVEFNKPYMVAGTQSVILAEAPPGSYVLYGGSLGGIFRAGLHVCFCLGTVGFEAKAGEVTDLGTFLGDAAKFPSSIPELAPETGFGPSSDSLFSLLAGTVRPVRSGDPVPPQLAGSKVVAADYRAVGRYFHPGALGLNRLVPVPGVLAYDREKVIDVKSGTQAPDHY